jgi:hypothetical protein
MEPVYKTERGRTHLKENSHDLQRLHLMTVAPMLAALPYLSRGRGPFQSARRTDMARCVAGWLTSAVGIVLFIRRGLLPTAPPIGSLGKLDFPRGHDPHSLHAATRSETDKPFVGLIRGGLFERTSNVSGQPRHFRRHSADEDYGLKEYSGATAKRSGDTPT